MEGQVALPLGDSRCLIPKNLNLPALLTLLNDIPDYRDLANALIASPAPSSHLPAEGGGASPTPLSHLSVEGGELGRASSSRLPDAPLGLLSAARPVVLAALHAHTQRPLLVVVARADHARALAHQIRAWSPHPAEVLRLPDPDALPYERVAWGRDTIRERARVLAALAGWSRTLQQADEGKGQGSPGDIGRQLPPLVVTSARALMQKTAPPTDFRAELSTLHVGQRVSVNELLSGWLDTGYRASSVVEEPAYFSRRGGILDIFSPNQHLPVRIELFGDEIDSLRTFDPLTQRSEERITAFDITPAHEALTRLAPSVAEAARQISFSSCHPVAQLNFEEDLVRLGNAESFRGIEFYLPFFYSQPASPLDYLPTDGVLIVEDPAELEAVVGDLEQQAIELEEDLRRQGELPAGWPRPYFTQAELTTELRRRPHLILGFGMVDSGSRIDNNSQSKIQKPQSVIRGFALAPVYGGQVKRLMDDLIERRRSGERVVLVSRQAARLGDLLTERDIPYLSGRPISPVEDMAEPLAGPVGREGDNEPPPPGSITVMQGSLAEGWILRAGSNGADSRIGPTCCLLTDTEIFGYHKPEPRRRPTVRRAVTPERFFADVRPGDYVVHIEHGIGVFQGLVKLSLEGVEREYLQVDYAAGDRLYVPIHQADRLSRYVGADDRSPVLNRLGAADWNIVKRRAKRAVEEIAAELLEIYAAREIAPGHAFASDSPWQQELESAFPYVETEDQLHAIEQVKADMEKPKPMDRLICGDVGYGKTEVALRAAFKSVIDGMQVALLVPTTVLAQQHYQTFAERLKPYPVVVEMLSRFRSRKEQKQILGGMQNGTVDIVIGTHRLLQKDVGFKNLGLLVIDEEQRFGVTHKERLKKMRTEVDVLTLTATPIPRTLHMSLTGVRDMSTIDTPPEERLPIKTSVAEYDETLIRTAILREMDRGGQIYFVHNRVMGIEQVAQRLAKIVPEATIAVAHGQMPERQLERVMMDFMSGQYDVLVCTSIIESGLDIPNANTIIINRADRLGLAQLYQLRGRVGRGAVRAYAYLLTPKNYELSQVARKRLETIVEASELGAGFRIAMRDLEIRGAGELLGARQHGHIAAVGFDLYCRLLAQAVRELKGESPERVTSEEAIAYLTPLAEGVQINLPMPVYLPEDYVPDDSLRLQLYRRLAGLTSEEEVTTMAQELEDRFGELPESVANLLYQLKLKVLAFESGIQAINVDSGQIVIKAKGLEHLDRDGLQRRVGPQTRVTRRQIWMPLHPNPSTWQAELEKILRLMHRMLHDPGG
jgi:transcription-repair coupling factor (superfamily II helicase)